MQKRRSFSKHHSGTNRAAHRTNQGVVALVRFCTLCWRRLWAWTGGLGQFQWQGAAAPGRCSSFLHLLAWCDTVAHGRDFPQAHYGRNGR